MSLLPVPRLLDRPPRWLGGLVAALLAFNLAAFKVAPPAAGCRGTAPAAAKACCAVRPGGCCCKGPASHDGIPAGAPAWRATDCTQRVEAGLIHPQWEPTLLADPAPVRPVASTPIEGDTGLRYARGLDPPPVPPPQVA
ncbi:MAG: hypothetical protein PVF51_06175 [Nitrospirota bacterium]|jgi:hypothetical protein